MPNAAPRNKRVKQQTRLDRHETFTRRSFSISSTVHRMLGLVHYVRWQAGNMGPRQLHKRKSSIWFAVKGAGDRGQGWFSLTEFSLSLCVDIGVAPAKAQKKSQKTLHQFDADAGAQVGHSNCFRWPSQARPGQARSGCGCGSIELSAAANYVSL